MEAITVATDISMCLKRIIAICFVKVDLLLDVRDSGVAWSQSVLLDGGVSSRAPSLIVTCAMVCVVLAALPHPLNKGVTLTKRPPWTNKGVSRR
jgi:hypothetical protein